MKVKYNTKFLQNLENIFAQSSYALRYEKGNFKSGYCILNQKRVVVVNKYYTLEGKINCLLEILKQVDWDFSELPEKEAQLFQQIKQMPSE